MTTLGEAIRKHHLSLSKTLQAHAGGVGGGETQRERQAFVAFLKGDLLPHARSEERYLYPAVDTLVREHGKPTATMGVDHEFIADYTARIERTTRALAGANNGERARLLRQLRDLALRLDAIVELHLAKEERTYLPLIEEHLDQARQHHLLQVIHEAYEEEKKMPSPDRPA
jgi:hemerythrin-like domain-containing protein